MSDVLNVVEPLSGEPTLKVRDLDGYPVMIACTAVDYEAKGLKGEIAPCVTMDVLVVGKGPGGTGTINFGDDRQGGTPANMTVQLPYLARGVLSSHVNIVRTVKRLLGQGSLTMGVIQRGTTQTQGNSAPWNLNNLDSADPARQLLMETWVAIRDGQRANSVPQPIGGAAPAAQASGGLMAAYAASAPAPAAVVTPMATASSKYASLPAGVTEQSADAILASNPALAVTMGIVLAAAAPAPAAPAPAAVPPGFTPESWAALDPASRAAVMNAMGG